MENKKWVVQISFDIVVKSEYDKTELVNSLADELENLGYSIPEAKFQSDVTDYYKEHYPKLFD